MSGERVAGGSIQCRHRARSGDVEEVDRRAAGDRTGTAEGRIGTADDIAAGILVRRAETRADLGRLM